MIAARLITGLWLSAALTFSIPAGAHHSFAPYESVKRVTLEGIAKSVQWANPHVVIRLLAQVPGGDGSQAWDLVTSNPGILKHFGWTARSVTAGTHIRVTCYPKRDGSHGGRLITLFQLDTGETLETKLSNSATGD